MVTDAAHFDSVARPCRGPSVRCWDRSRCYLAMRGIKTLPAAHGAAVRQCLPGRSWLAAHPAVERVYFPADPAHPDAATIRRLFPDGLYGAIVSFELKGAGREEVFRFMNALRMIVRGTSLGDVHTMMLYPAMSSHREISPQAPRAHGHPRQPGAAVGGHRSGGRHHRRPGSGAAVAGTNNGTAQQHGSARVSGLTFPRLIRLVVKKVVNEQIGAELAESGK